MLDVLLDDAEWVDDVAAPSSALDPPVIPSCLVPDDVLGRVLLKPFDLNVDGICAKKK